MDATDRLAEQMEVLRMRFRLRCPEQARAVLEACAAANVESIQRLAHNIAGSAGLFGFASLSEEAASLSACCRTGSADDILVAARAMSCTLAALGPDGQG